MAIIDRLTTLKDGVCYGVDEAGKVFVLDRNGDPAGQPVPESLASEVREAIRRGKATRSE